VVAQYHNPEARDLVINISNIKMTVNFPTSELINGFTADSVAPIIHEYEHI
jgi:hypothetical protein